MSYTIYGSEQLSRSLLEVANFLQLSSIQYSNEELSISSTLSCLQGSSDHSSITLASDNSTEDEYIFSYLSIIRFFLNCASASQNLQKFSDFQLAKIDSWICFASNNLPLLHNDNSLFTEDALKTSMKSLDDFLADHTFFVGEELSVADVVIVHALSNHLIMISSNKFENLTRWFNTCVSREGLFEQFSELVDGSDIQNIVLSTLQQLNINHTTREHERAFTMDELIPILEWEDVEGYI